MENQILRHVMRHDTQHTDWTMPDLTAHCHTLQHKLQHTATNLKKHILARAPLSLSPAPTHTRARARLNITRPCRDQDNRKERATLALTPGKISQKSGP